jgi:serine/threonine protein kinase
MMYPLTLQEYMGGGTVHQLLLKEMMAGMGHVYSTIDALDICLQIGQGLQYLHTLKPMVRVMFRVSHLRLCFQSTSGSIQRPSYLRSWRQ